MEPQNEIVDVDDKQQKPKRKAKVEHYDGSPQMLPKKQRPDKTSLVNSKGNVVQPNQCKNTSPEKPSSSILDISETWTSGSEEEAAMLKRSVSEFLPNMSNITFEGGEQGQNSGVETSYKALGEQCSSPLGDVQTVRPPMPPPLPPRRILAPKQETNRVVNSKITKEIDTGFIVKSGSILSMQRSAVEPLAKNDTIDPRTLSCYQGLQGSILGNHVTKMLNSQTNNMNHAKTEQHSQSLHKSIPPEATAMSMPPPQNHGIARPNPRQNNEQVRKMHSSIPQTRDIGELVAYGVKLRLENEMTAKRVARQAQHARQKMSGDSVQVKPPSNVAKRNTTKSSEKMDIEVQQKNGQSLQQRIGKVQAGKSLQNNHSSFHHPLQRSDCLKKVQEIGDAEAQLRAEGMAFTSTQAEHRKAYYRQTLQQTYEVSKSNRKLLESLASEAFGLDGTIDSRSPPSITSSEDPNATISELSSDVQTPEEVIEASNDESIEAKELEDLGIAKMMAEKMAEEAAKERGQKKYESTKLGDYKALDNNLPSNGLSADDPAKLEFNKFDRSVLIFDNWFAIQEILAKPVKEPGDNHRYRVLSHQLRQIVNKDRGRKVNFKME